MIPVPEKYVRRVQDFLLPEEVAEVAAKETRWPIFGSLIRPVLIVATNKRVIVTRRDIFRLYKHFKIIMYHNITNVHVRHGIIFSSIHLGVVAEVSTAEGEVWTKGLRYKDVVDLSRFVHNKVMEQEERIGPVKGAEKQIGTRGYKK